MLTRGWKLIDKGDINFVGDLLSKPIVDFSRDGKVFVVVVGLNEVRVVMDYL